jgi:hypothetical protein
MEKYNKQEQYKYTYSREQYKHTSYRNNAKQLTTGTIQNTNYREKYKDTTYLEHYKIHQLHGTVQIIQSTGTNLK